MQENMIVSDEQRDISDLLIDWMVLSEGLNDTHADWLPFLVFGMPYVQVAKIFGCDKSNITHALKAEGNGLARAVTKGRSMVKRQLHYVWLDQKAVQAWRNIDYFLQIDPFETDEKDKYVHSDAIRKLLIQERARMSRFVIQQLGLHVQRYEVKHTAPPPMFMGDSSLAKLVVERVTMAMSGEQGDWDPDVISGEYHIVGDEGSQPMKPSEEEAELEAPYDRRRSGDYQVWSGETET
jgi:hypothetical protein